MGRIPLVVSNERVRSRSLEGGVTRGIASPQAFGATEARATQLLARGVGELSDAAAGVAERQRVEDAANSIANFDYSRRMLDQQTQAPAEPIGFAQQVTTDYDNAVIDHVSSITDDRVRRAVREKLMSRKPQVSAQANEFEVKQVASYRHAKANEGLASVQNRVRSDPSGYDAALEDGFGIINTRPGIPASVKENMRRQFREDLARSRFEALGASADTPEQVDGIVAELAQPRWQKELAPADYERIMDGLSTSRKAIATKETAEARATLQALTDRNGAGVAIDPVELQEARKSVERSKNPALMWQLAEIEAQQNVYRTEGNLPPAELRARINAGKGSPSAAYPGLPEPVSAAIDNAVRLTGGAVSPAYLGGTVMREYGQYLQRAPSSTSARYRPQVVHGGVDLRNINPQVVEAASVAGEIFGAPLSITSGHRTQAQQDAIRRRGDPDRAAVARRSKHTAGTAVDVSTMGMSPERRAELVDALVQAGFTGFGEYDTHIHADFRDSVPASFDAVKGWGGWTKLSPEVQQTLVRRGFVSGGSAANVDRRGAGGQQRQVKDGFDYTKGTAVIDADGAPVTSAVGIFQFTEETFIEAAQNNRALLEQLTGRAADTFSRQELLALRGNVEVATALAAMTALRNKRQLENAIGRSVTDAELHSAHVFGAAGAVAMLSALGATPDAYAKDILPKAAKNNPGLFFDGGTPKTVREVYGDIENSFMGAPSRVAFARTQARENIYAKQQKALKDDMVSYAGSAGRFSIVPLSDADPGSYSQRGRQAREIGEYYSIAPDDIEPLTKDEAAGFIKTVQEGTADEVVDLMARLQELGPEMARAAYKQLGEDAPVFELAAGLAYDDGQRNTARDIVRGQKRIVEQPDVKSLTGATQDDVIAAFFKAAGKSVAGADPRTVQAMREASLAHYVETFVTRGAGKIGQWDDDAFAQSVSKVIGQGGLGEVNGEPTVLPPGVDEATMEQAVDNMALSDYSRMSIDGLPPVYLNGDVADPLEIAQEGKFRAIGGGEYRVEMADGQFLLSTADAGEARFFIFKPDPEELVQIANRVGGSRAEPATIGVP